MKNREYKSELICKTRHKNGQKQSQVVAISRDGWVISKDGAFGDNEQDCDIEWGNQVEHLRNLRKSKGLTQQEMAWIFGVTRQTYMKMEKGKAEMTHKQYLLSLIINENF